MKKHIILLLSAAFTIGITLNSCGKKGCTNERATNYDEKAKKDDGSCVYGDTTRPNITIEEPSMEMYHLHNGSVDIPIKVTVTDENTIHDMMVVLTNTTAETEALHIHLHPDAGSASVDTSFTATVVHQDYELKVTATDHDENEAVKAVYTHVHDM